MVAAKALPLLVDPLLVATRPGTTSSLVKFIAFSVTESYNCPDTFADPYAHILLVRARWRFLQKVHQAHRLRVLWRCKWVRALCRRQP